MLLYVLSANNNNSYIIFDLSVWGVTLIILFTRYGKFPCEFALTSNKNAKNSIKPPRDWKKTSTQFIKN